MADQVPALLASSRKYSRRHEQVRASCQDSLHQRSPGADGAIIDM